MSFNATPLDGSASPIPMSSAVSPGDQTPRPVMGGPKTTDSNGNILAPVAAYHYDGYNVTQGAMADAASTDATQTTKSAMSFWKGLVKILADVWDSTNHWLQVKVMNANANGQAIMAGSAPVAVASDQSPLPTRQDATVAVRSAVAYGASFIPKTGAAGPGYVAVSLFNPVGSGKLFSLYVAEWECDSQQFALLQTVATDPNFNGTNKGSIPPVNRTIGSSNTSVANVTWDNTGTSTLVGTTLKGQTGSALTTYDLIKPEFPLEVQAGSGVVLFIHQNQNGYSFSFEWGEQ